MTSSQEAQRRRRLATRALPISVLGAAAFVGGVAIGAANELEAVERFASAWEGGDYAAIGPSSGFSPAEKQLLAGGGFRPVRLGLGRLRTETAAVVWAGCREALRNPPGAAG